MERLTAYNEAEKKNLEAYKAQINEENTKELEMITNLKNEDLEWFTEYQKEEKKQEEYMQAVEAVLNNKELNEDQTNAALQKIDEDYVAKENAEMIEEIQQNKELTTEEKEYYIKAIENPEEYINNLFQEMQIAVQKSLEDIFGKTEQNTVEQEQKAENIEEEDKSGKIVEEKKADKIEEVDEAGYKI